MRSIKDIFLRNKRKSEKQSVDALNIIHSKSSD